MDFDSAKENIQPLAQGRNASILQASLKIESPQELLAQRRELEKEIHNYNGDDPLSVWYNYVEWIEQSFPSGGKESGLKEVLSKCLSKFESDERYKQDRRMIKLYIKFIDGLQDPAECYQQLFNAGIGTMVADFYIAWAYCYDLADNIRKADEVFRRGISCRAQPLEDLQEAHQHFGFSVAQRLMYKDNDSVKEETNRQLHERRLALTSLRGHRRKQIVGSIRTGLAVKSVMPGTIKIDQPTTSQRGNERVEVFADENDRPNAIPLAPTDLTDEVKSAVHSIIDAARDQENQKEPGPWNKVHGHKKGKLFGKSTATNELGFEIHKDDDEAITCENVKKLCIPPIPIADSEIRFNKPFIYPPKFCAQSKPIKGWITPVTTEEKPDKNAIAQYNKCKLYPRPNMEFSPEELKGYVIFKKRSINNAFTKECDIYWGCGPEYNIRMYPHFATLSKIENIIESDEIYIPSKMPGMVVAFNEIYNNEHKVELQFEEILASRIKRNETIITATDMEETMCITSEKIQRRKSFFPMRKSLASSAFKALSKMSVKYDSSEVCEKSSSKDLTEPSTSIQASLSASKENSTLLSNSKRKENSVVTPITNYIRDETFQRNKETTDNTSIYIQSQQCSDEINTKATSPKTFEIFKDESVSELGKNAPSVNKTTVAKENDFQFKTPALPLSNSVITSVPGASNKIEFEIYEDVNLPNSNTNSILKTETNFFDPEETCSTHTFNIFLRAQSVSTPKSIAKCQPQMQIGNILKEVTPTIPEQKEYQQFSTCTDTPIPSAATTVAVTFSPPRQQLSTILETSEHGTTQGTHTTGATTKSTLSSPEFDLEYHTQAATANQQQPALEPVKESSSESSFVASPRCYEQNVEKLMNSMKIVDVTDNALKTQPEIFPTPAATRLENKTKSNGLHFSIFEDDVNNANVKKVGNFSRLEEKEDTETFKTVPQINFQDDKTETITKVHITSQQVKFQDDKTETVPKIFFQPTLSAQLPEEKTDITSKILLNPSQPTQFPEDTTENMSNYMLAPPKLSKFEEDMSENFKTKSGVSDDSFAFFGQTPPKASKHLVCKQLESGSLPQMRTAMNTQTPLSRDCKRFCDKDTPDLQKSKPIALFESKPDLFKHSINKECNSKVDFSSKNLYDFSLIVNSESTEQTNNNKEIFKKSKSVFRDSFIPDFSIIDDSQPVTKNSPECKTKPINKSFLPEFSYIEGQQRKQTKSVDISYIPETQPDISIIKSSQPIESRILKQPSTTSNLKLPFHDDFSKINVDENKDAEDICWKHTAKDKAFSNSTQEGTSLKNILMDTFMKDFSEPHPVPKNFKEIGMVQSSKNTSLRFLNESVNKKPENRDLYAEKAKNSIVVKLSPSLSRETKLNFLHPEHRLVTPPQKEKTGSTDKENDKYFELNCETELFGTNISMIKNSTWLPNHGPGLVNCNKQVSQIQENSLHIKHEEISSTSSSRSTLNDPQNGKCGGGATSKLSSTEKPLCNNDFSIEISASELAAINANKLSTNTIQSIFIPDSPEPNDDSCEMSIYYKKTPKTPKAEVHIWDDSDALKLSTNNHYVHAETDLNQTHQIIENMVIDPNVNPFNVDLINAFLEQHYVISYLESLPTCKLVGGVQRLKPHATINVKGVHFEVLKLVGEGAYGAVFCGKEVKSGKQVAMKQEKPPNYWEYYICLEIQERIRVDEMLPAYMSVDYALIGNNSSILISRFSQYGSLITVCNKIKKYTMKNVDEYVVMLLASELLEIMDHLHAANIIHADIKADNFLLMNKLKYPPTERCLQLIDFGVSIDMKLFKQGQVFNFIHNDNSFKCPEMREERPWTYQLDLYGLAGVFHVLLFGKYMDIEKNARGFWMHKTRVPRYVNKSLWDEIFKTLLNIRDCSSMPNLQDLRALLKKEIEEKEKYVIRMVNEFNRALGN
ncbi:hypothetical protein DOY81_007034 [Sarcophaga bullata]|nr:hypothetical protein DOY81_007034 [Sarcophaga bullata]